MITFTRIYLLSLVLLMVNLKATIHTVATDGSGDFTQVQVAINQAVAYDTVLIEPGTYYENINFQGRDLVVGSRYLLTQDDSYIGTTILDGNHNGSVVVFEHAETRAAQLVGLTIQHGNGTNLPAGGVFWSGGGILVMEIANPSIMACTIKQNTLEGMGVGGGITILGGAYLSRVKIYNNTSPYFCGGLYFRGNGDTQFDTQNLCSIYGNYSGYGNDIYSNIPYGTDPPFDTLLIPLDTGSVAYRDRHFIDVPPFFPVSVNHGTLTPVPHDLYVSPTGNDSSSGLSPDNPLRTIQYALALIRADSANPRTVHLSPGRYAPSGGQLFPLNIRSFVNLTGSGRDTTILDNEYTFPDIIEAFYDRDYKVSNMMITGAGAYTTDGFEVVDIWDNIGAVYDNMIFQDNEVMAFNCSKTNGSDSTWEYATSVVLSNMIIKNNVYKAGRLDNIVDIRVKNIQIENVIPIYRDGYDDFQALGFSISSGARSVAGIRTFENVTITHVNNPFTQAQNPASAMLIYRGWYTPKVRLVNCTITDNVSIGGGAIALNEGSLVIVNSIIWGNVPRQLWFTDYGNPEAPTTLTVKNSIFQGAQWGLGGYGSLDLHWLDGNLDQDPLFTGDEDNPYTLSANSPAIDAGTDFFVYEGDTLVNLSPNEYTGLAPDMGAYEYTGPVSTQPEELTLEDFTLSAPYPNPFNPTTRIDFYLPQQSQVSLTIYDVTGRMVARPLENVRLEKGRHHYTWDASGRSSGVYFTRLTLPDNREAVQKLVLMK